MRTRALIALLAAVGCADGTPEPEFRQYTRDAEVEDARVAPDGAVGDMRIPRDAAPVGEPARVEAWPEARVLGHDRAGALVLDTDAAADLAGVDMVTVFGEVGEAGGVIRSVVAPRGALRFADPADARRLAWPATIQLPGPLAGAASYDITLGCVGVRFFDATVPFEANVPRGCLTADGIAWVLALALDEADRPLAFTHGRIVDAPAEPVALGPWRMDFARKTIDVDGEADAHAMWRREQIGYGILGRATGAGPRAFDLAADFGATHWRAEAWVDLADPPQRALLRAWVDEDAERVRLAPDGLAALSGERVDGAVRWSVPAAAQSVRIDVTWTVDERPMHWIILAPAERGSFTVPTAGIPRAWRPTDDARWGLTAVACPPVEGPICPADLPATPPIAPFSGWRVQIGI